MAVTRHKDVGCRVMEIVVRSPGYDLEDGVLECADLTWNQAFLDIDRLSREGDVIPQFTATWSLQRQAGPAGNQAVIIITIQRRDVS